MFFWCGDLIQRNYMLFWDCYFCYVVSSLLVGIKAQWTLIVSCWMTMAEKSGHKIGCAYVERDEKILSQERDIHELVM